MHLVQILLPLSDNQDQPFPQTCFTDVTNELTKRFGGLTAYTRAPADGVWRQPGKPAARDEIVVYEVMVRDIDRSWWQTYREHLERAFRQQSVVIRASPVELL